MKYLLVKNINELIDKPLHSPCIIYETDNEKVRYEDYGNTMFYFNELDGKLVATSYKITLKKDTFEDSDIIDILDILEVEGPTTNLRFKINDSRFLLKNSTIIPRVAHVETDLELTVYTKYTEETFILHIVCEDDLQIIREFKNATYPDTIEGYLNKITITYTEVVTVTNALGTKKVESEETYDHYFVSNVNTDHTTEDFGTNEDTIESRTREVYLKFNEEDYYLGTVTLKNKNHKETWCYYTDNTIKVFNLELSLYDGVSWNNMDMANTYRLIVGSTVTKFFGLMVSGSPLNTIIFENTIDDYSPLASTTVGLENLKKVVCKGLAYGSSSGLSKAINVEEIYLLGNDTTLRVGFAGCNAIKKLVLPKTLTAIPDGLCSNAANLSSITLYDNITSIGIMSFGGCGLLENIKIPNSVTSIGLNAFRGCYKLESIDIPNSVTSLGNGAFSACAKLTSVTIGNSVTSIGYDAFEGCSGLTSIDIPNSVTRIEELAFGGCLSLVNVRFEDGDGNVFLSNTAFSQCPIETLYLGRNLNSNSYKFADIPTLATITIGNSVKIIGSSAFSNCGITELEFPDSVETIEYSVAINCSNLKKLKLPVNLKSMTSGLCTNCSNLDTINDEYLCATLPDSLTSINPDVALLPFIGTKIKTLVIPKNITSLTLGGSLNTAKNLETCILHCKEAIEQENICIFLLFGMGIKKVFIPEECSYFSVDSMPYGGLPPGISLNTEEPDVFKLPDAYTGEFGLGSYETNLKEVILSDNVTSLGHYAAFGLSNNLETVDLKNVHTINASILGYRTKLDYIKLSKNITFIDSDSLSAYGGNASSDTWGFLEIDWDIVDFLFSYNSSYFWISRLLKLNIEKNTELLSARFNIKELGISRYPCILNISDEGSYINIANNVFFDLPIKFLHIPERVQSIAPESFNSKYLESITVDSTNSYYTDCNGSNILVDKIDNSLLLGCAASTIPEGVVKIHTNAFYECLKLHELEIPETVTTLDRYAINICQNLGLLKIKNRSTLNIGDYAVNTPMPTQVILDVTSVPTISSISFRLGNDHKIYIPKNLESAFKSYTNWAKLNLVPCESFDTFTVKAAVNVEALDTPIIANIGEVLPLSIKVDGKPTSLVGDLQYYNTLGEHTLELTYLSALHLGMASESIVRDWTSDAGANTIVNIEYLDTNSIEEKTTKSQLLDTTTKNSTHTLNTDPYSEYGVVTVYYDILNITSATRLFSSHYNNVCAITVDGEPVSPTRALYWFTTPGIHTVKYYFYNKYHCFEYGHGAMFIGIEGISKIEIGESFNFIYKLLLSNATVGSLQVNSSNPPVITGNGVISLSCPIYVPAESVEMYKTSSYGWSTYADNIQAIS